MSSSAVVSETGGDCVEPTKASCPHWDYGEENVHSSREDAEVTCQVESASRECLEERKPTDFSVKLVSSMVIDKYLREFRRTVEIDLSIELVAHSSSQFTRCPLSRLVALNPPIIHLKCNIHWDLVG